MRRSALVVEADARHPVEHRDRRGRHARVAQDALELARRLEIAGAGKPVRDDRRLERDDRRSAFERGGDLFGDDECGHATILASRAPVRTGRERESRADASLTACDKSRRRCDDSVAASYASMTDAGTRPRSDTW